MDDAAARRQMIGTQDLLLAICTLAMGDEAPRVDVEQLKKPLLMVDGEMHRDWLRKAS